MSAPVTAPSKGHPIRAQWATDVTHRLNDCAAALAAGAVKDTANLRGSVAVPHPFQVVGGTDEGDAKLTVYVPTGSLVIADEEIDAGDIEGISAVDGAPGYYTVDDLDDLATTAAGAQPLNLVIWRDDTETTPSTNATVTLDPESVEGTVILQATIARVWKSTPEGGSKTYGAVSEQIIRSAVHVGGGTGGGGGGGGGGYGYTGPKYVIYDFDGPRSDGKFYAKIKIWNFENGLFVSEDENDASDIVVFETTPHSEE